MTNDQLLMLEAVVKAGSFKAASRLLHKSQPSLSVGIKKIEEEFGIVLFSRDGYRPELTSEGRAFYQKALLSLETFRSLETFANELGKGVEPEIHLALDALCPLDKIRDVLRTLFFCDSSTSLKLSIETLGGASEKVAMGEADMAIAPLLDEKHDFETQSFIDIRMVPVIETSLMEGAMTIGKLRNLPQIVVKDSSQYGESSSVGLLSHGKKWFTDDNAMKRELIVQGLGWGRLPEHSIDEHLQNKSLMRLDLKEVKSSNASLHLIRRKSHPQGPMAKRLWSELFNLTQK